MNEPRDERWLDSELERAISQTNLEFDAETWKSKHAEAYQSLLARESRSAEPKIQTTFLFPRATKLAFAAAILVVGILAFFAPRPETTPQTGPRAGSSTEIRSASIVSLESLTLAYRRGGEEALNKQLDTAQETLGPRPDRALLSDLLKDLRG